MDSQLIYRGCNGILTKLVLAPGIVGPFLNQTKKIYLHSEKKHIGLTENIE